MSVSASVSTSSRLSTSELSHSIPNTPVDGRWGVGQWGGGRGGRRADESDEQVGRFGVHPRADERERGEVAHGHPASFGERVPTASHDDHVVVRHAVDVELLEQFDPAQRADHDVDLASSQASREFAPGCDEHSQSEPGVLRVQAADHGGDQRRAAPRADTDVQLAEFHALRQADLALEITGAGVECPRVSKQQSSHVGGLDARRTAVEERRAHLRFQRLDAARQGRLRDVRRGGRPAEVAVLGYGDQMSKAAQFHATIMPYVHGDDDRNALDTLPSERG